MVTSTEVSWWFTDTGEAASFQFATTLSGTIASWTELIATPVVGWREGGAAGPGRAAGPAARAEAAVEDGLRPVEVAIWDVAEVRVVAPEPEVTAPLAVVVLVVEALDVEPPVVEALVVEAPLIEPLVVEEQDVDALVVEALVVLGVVEAVVEAAVVDALVIEAPVVEALLVKALVVEALVVEELVVEAQDVEALVDEAPLVEALVVVGVVEAVPDEPVAKVVLGAAPSER
jgi:hypothetical protein